MSAVPPLLSGVAHDRAPKPVRPVMHLRPSVAAARYEELTRRLPGVQMHYAVKCNPSPALIQAIAAAGASFEIASAAELDTVLATTSTAPEDILFSHPVKTVHDVAHAYARGVRTYVLDSLCEVDKLASWAPGSRVIVRLSASSNHSVVASEGKFGIAVDDALALLVEAVRRGLVPHGVSFHVGSQMLDPAGYLDCIQRSLELIRRSRHIGMDLKILDIGGGFPVRYDDVEPAAIDRLFTAVAEALKSVPRNLAVIAEPGRAIAADVGVIEAHVIGVAKRGQTLWAHLDLGAFNGLMEALETNNTLRYPVWDSRGMRSLTAWNLTGPTCDSQDSLLFGVPLSRDLEVNDRVYVGKTGAYTMAYTNSFNGFEPPVVQLAENGWPDLRHTRCEQGGATSLHFGNE